MVERKKLIPIYTTRGDLGGFLVYPYIYNDVGEWIGWVTPDRTVYSVHGQKVGMLTKEPRILRKREWDFNQQRLDSPETPPPIRLPAHVPLAPQMPEVAINMIDVLQEAPDLLPPIDFGEGREDMD